VIASSRYVTTSTVIVFSYYFGSHLLLFYFLLPVAGPPKPRQNHAIVMAKFAQEILQAMKVATSELDSQLGPGTTELAIRNGVRVFLSLQSYTTTASGFKQRFLTLFCYA
jgi:hypothetical protein